LKADFFNKHVLPFKVSSLNQRDHVSVRRGATSNATTHCKGKWAIF